MVAPLPRSGIAATFALLLLVNAAGASDMSYRPVNPSFGGNALNGNYLFGQATAQDRSKDKSQASASGPTQPVRSSVEQFKQQIQSRLMSAMASQIVDSIYGTNAQDSGHFQIDDLDIAFEKINGEVRVTLQDGTGTTVIALPQPVTVN